MICPVCNDKLGVDDTITTVEHIYRRRKCLGCGARFFTDETIVPDAGVKPMFNEWSRERARKCRAEKKGMSYEPNLSYARDLDAAEVKKPARALF